MALALIRHHFLPTRRGCNFLLLAQVSFADKDVILWDSEVLVRRRDELLELEHAFSPEQKLQLPIHPKGACDTLFLLMCLKAHALTSHLDDMGLNIMVDAMDEVVFRQKEGLGLRDEGGSEGGGQIGGRPGRKK